MELMLEEGNPYGAAYYNPRRRKRSHRKNPTTSNPLKGLTGGMKQWTQGVELTDVLAGAAGLAAATILPGKLIKNKPGTTAGTFLPLTTLQKVLKVTIATAAALAVGVGVKQVMSQKAAQAAIIGGVSGAAIQAVGAFTSVKIGQPIGQLQLGAGDRLGANVPMYDTRERVIG